MFLADITNVPSSRLLTYLSNNGFSILKSLYEEENNREVENIKIDTLKRYIGKTSDELLFEIKKLNNTNREKQYIRNILLLLLFNSINPNEFQQFLEKINEKSEIQKKNGVYYTPEDVSSYIIVNSIKLHLNSNISTFQNENQFISEVKLQKENKKLIDSIINFSIFDPTCGTGAFILKSFDIKIDLLKQINLNISSKDLEKIIGNLYGNDIDPFSTYISQTRLFFKAFTFCHSINLKKIFKIFHSNFYNFDFLTDFQKIHEKYDLILGNPPYVEKNKLKNCNNIKYGNIYADVIQNSFSLLKEKGTIGYIIPISYISTPRFSTLRSFIEKNTASQYILSFADRPDCLFVKVHQKLNILIAHKQSSKQNSIYTSDYIYWYKSERDSLFSHLYFVANNFKHPLFYPKIGNIIEENIYKKILNNKTTIYQIANGNMPLYINMRATFWIKSFINLKMASKEYKQFLFSKEYLPLIHIILNSSLFWWFWIKVSDCWHITQKELSLFTIPVVKSDIFIYSAQLSQKLEKALEKTKEKVDTKQTMFEYKHKKCKSIIDEIDNFLEKLYNLSPDELEYIKSYKENYRLGINNYDESN